MKLSFEFNRQNTGGIVAACLLFVLGTSNVLAQINKCNINGTIVYTEEECPSGSKQKLKLKPLTTVPSIVTHGDPSHAGLGNYRSSKWYSDHAGYARAVQISREENAPILIYGYTDWCGFCKKLKREMLSDPGVKDTLLGYVKVKINPEHSAADQKLFERWGGTGYPTLFIQNGPNAIPQKTSGPFKRKNGKWKLMTKNEFIAMLEKYL